MTKTKYDLAACGQFVKLAREWNRYFLQARRTARSMITPDAREKMMFLAGKNRGRALGYLLVARQYHPNFSASTRRLWTAA